MSSVSPPERSGIERFFDNFLRESSIKWMLVSGAAIVAASSLAQVSSHWSSWPPAIKYLAILSYTAAAYGVAECAARKYQLHSTSQVLRLLTLVLIPIGFLSLSWLTGDGETAGIHQTGLNLLLLVPGAAFMFYASTRIFDDWLQGRQTTFVAAYLVLCLAGAMPAIHHTWLAVLFSGGFWLVMTLGVVKVNRHIFWLTEEHRWPRVFGFVPVVLLSALLITLLASKTWSAIPLQWIGLGTVMLATTILMTTRTISSVFRQRTGDLVRPLPWTIVAPLFTGLVLVAIGVLFSFYGFHFVGPTTRAVVPTALLAAGLLITTAKDTRHRGFVWAGLILVAIAYQSTPTLFSDLVNHLKTNAAQTLHEERLPLAFYGVTYLPLLIGFALSSRVLGDRRRFEFSRPLQQFVTGASIILTAVALTHLKAAFLVTSLSFLTFTLYAILFRDRHYLLPAIASLIIASALAVPFLITTQLANVHSGWCLGVIAVLGLVLSATKWFDRLSLRVPHVNPSGSKWLVDGDGLPRPWFRLAGEMLAVVSSLGWLLLKILDVFEPGVQLDPAVDGVVGAAVLTSLFLWTTRSRNYACGLGMWVVAISGGALWIVHQQISMEQVVAALSIFSGVVMLSGYAFLRNTSTDTSVKRFLSYGQTKASFTCASPTIAIVLPLADLTLAIFITLVSLVYLPSLLWATLALNVDALRHEWLIVSGLVGLSAVMFRGAFATASSVLLAPIVAGVAIGCFAPSLFTYAHLPLIYAVTTCVLLTSIYQRVQTARPVLIVSCSLWLFGLVILGFAFISPTTLIGSAISLVAVFLLVRDRLTLPQRTNLAILVSAQAILAMTLGAGFRGFIFALPVSDLFAASCAWMLAGVAVALVAFTHPWKSMSQPLTQQWSLSLRLVGLMMFAFCLSSDGIHWMERFLLVTSLAAIAFNEWRTAVRLQRESYVWMGMAVIGLIAVWFTVHHPFPVPRALIRSCLVAIAPLALYMAGRWNEHPRFGVLVRGLKVVGLSLPFIVTGRTWLDHNHHPIESLLVFASAIVLFVYGRTTQQRRFVIAAAVVMNFGFAMLWSDLSLGDPQFYLLPIGLTIIGLVQLLRQDIPAAAHDPLRYVGALAILVSPCFEILGGSWVHIVLLMVLSVMVILLAIGLRLRALVHTGAAFLCVDLVAAVIRSTIDHPGMLWVTGLLIGGLVIAIAAVCENHRERLLSRIRSLSAELATWH